MLGVPDAEEVVVVFVVVPAEVFTAAVGGTGGGVRGVVGFCVGFWFDVPAVIVGSAGFVVETVDLTIPVADAGWVGSVN